MVVYGRKDPLDRSWMSRVSLPRVWLCNGRPRPAGGRGWGGGSETDSDCNGRGGKIAYWRCTVNYGYLRLDGYIPPSVKETEEEEGKEKRRVRDCEVLSTAVFTTWYWYRYILVVIQISYAIAKQEDSKEEEEEESYSNIN